MSPQAPQVSETRDDVADRVPDRPLALASANRAPQVAGDDFDAAMDRLGTLLGDGIARAVFGR
jgi:hypothetical protein